MAAWRRIAAILDLYYTRREQDDNARSLEVNLGDYPAPCCVARSDGDPVYRQHRTRHRRRRYLVTIECPLARNFLFKTQDKIVAAGWNNEFRSAVDVHRDISYSKAKRNEQQSEINAQYGSEPRIRHATLLEPTDTHDMPSLRLRHRLRRRDPGPDRSDDLRLGLQQDSAAGTD